MPDKVETLPATERGSLEMTEEKVRGRAYELFEKRGSEHGHEIEDWLEAEAEILGRKPGAFAGNDESQHTEKAAEDSKEGFTLHSEAKVNGELPKTKDCWDKADVIGKIVGALFMPVVILIAGYLVNLSLQQRANQQKTTELAITILQSDKSDKTPELRKWALQVLQNTATSASQSLPPAVVEELKRSPLPAAPTPSAHYDVTSPFPVVGSRFTPDQFRQYVASLDFSSWRPEFVVLHSTVAPDLEMWHKQPESKRLQTLASFYGSAGFSGGPHLIIDDEGIWVFNPMTKPGVHSPSWNKNSIGIMMVGNFSDTPGDAKVVNNALAAIATIDRALGLKADTLKFHSEDPKSTHKDCPGKTLDKQVLIEKINVLLPRG